MTDKIPSFFEYVRVGPDHRGLPSQIYNADRLAQRGYKFIGFVDLDDGSRAMIFAMPSVIAMPTATRERDDEATKVR